MNVVSLAAVFNLRRLGPARCRLMLLVDPSPEVTAPIVTRWLAPWRGWLQVVAAATAAPRDLVTICGTAAGVHLDAVLVISPEADTVAAVREAATAQGLVCVTPDLPAEGSRERGLLQEVVHHDIELGGWNHWSNVDSGWAPVALRVLSTDNSRLVFPQYVLPYLFPDGRHRRTERVRGLDIGCGSLSHLRWGALEGWLSITGVDPLLDMYAVLRERHGLSALPHIHCDTEICAGAEALAAEDLAEAFDFAFSINALDHTEDPSAIVRHIGTVLKPGGIAAFEVNTREGTREAWWTIHQFDMYLDGGRFMAQRREGTPVDLMADARLEIVKVITDSPEKTRLVAQKGA